MRLFARADSRLSRPLTRGFCGWLRHTVDPPSPDRLALLIDADNTSHKALDVIMAEVSRHGNAVVKRSYGDFTTSTLAPWKEPMADHAILPKQSFNNIPGKNNSDSAMIIDAMDLLHSRRFDVFCLVTSDSDFTSLAIRLREDGITVVGIGYKQSLALSRSFVAACDTFIEIETLETAAVHAVDVLETPLAQRAMPTRQDGLKWSADQTKQFILLLQIIIEEGDADGWARLDKVGMQLKKRDPAFDARKLGASSTKLTNLVEVLDMYETRKANKSSLFVRPGYWRD